MDSPEASAALAGVVVTGCFTLATLLLAGAGWLLQKRSERQEEFKATVGLLLWGLLDLRHVLLARSATLDALRERLGTLPGDAVVVDQMLAWAVPNPLPGKEDYNDAVSTIAEYRPDLAFRLSGRMEALSAIGGTSPLVNELLRSDPPPEVLQVVLDQFVEIRRQILPIIDGLILELAWAHGLRTCCRIRRLKRDPARDEELSHLMDDSMAKLSHLLPQKQDEDDGPDDAPADPDQQPDLDSDDRP